MPGKLSSLVAASFVLGCVSAASADTRQVLDRHFTVATGGRLVLKSDLGTVAVVGGDGRDVRLHVEMSESDHLRVDAVQGPDGVTITGKRVDQGLQGWLGLTHSDSHVRFRIIIPRDLAVALQTGGGGIEVDDVAASVSAHTSGGAIVLHGTGGPIDAHTSGGDIDAQHIRGPAKLETSGGGIRVADAAGDVDANTSGGSIDLSAIEGKVNADTSGGGITADMHSNHGIHLSSSGGPITLRVPPNVRARLDAHTSGGSVHAGITVARTNGEDESRLQGTINGGGEPIVLETSGGGIRIEPLN